MKINKVNIHAFRLFGDESVDFSAKKDSRKTANFVTSVPLKRDDY